MEPFLKVCTEYAKFAVIGTLTQVGSSPTTTGRFSGDCGKGRYRRQG